MREIEQIYHNDFGISFYWKNQNKTFFDRVQLIFKETGFYFSISELKDFDYLIEDSLMTNACCDECALKNKCHRFLLKTPCSQIDLAVSMDELKAIEDLVKGSLFKIQLEEYIYGVGIN